MTWRPRTYADYIVDGGENVLEGFPNPQPGKSHQFMAACPCSPKPKPAFLLVDTRAISDDFVDQDWSCDTCWTGWVRTSGRVERIFAEIVEQLKDAPDENAIPLLSGYQLKSQPTVKTLRSMVVRLRGIRAQRTKSSIASELKDNGFVTKTPRYQCFPLHMWIEWLGGPPDLVARHKGSKYDHV